MASNGIILIPNQPIQFYKQDPTDSELALGMTPWEQTAYHKRLGVCGFIGPNYCHPVLDTDFMTFQFKLPTVDGPVIGAIYDTVYLFSLNTSTSPNQLVDSLATFIGNGVEVDELVINYDNADNNSSFVQNVVSETTLDLDEDIFLTDPNTYAISFWKGAGEWKYNGLTNKLSMTTPSPTDFYFENALVVDKYYKVTLKVDSVTAGNFQVRLGTNSIATINSAGTHVLYGKCEGNTTFMFRASSAFVGVISDAVGDELEVLEINTEYTIAIFDLDGNNVANITQDAADTEALSIGNAFVNIEWGNFALECGSYVAAIFEGGGCCIGNMVTNGNFADGETGWTLGSNMSIAAGKVQFASAPVDSVLENRLACNIVKNCSYNLTYVVSALDLNKFGNYTIEEIPGGAIRNFTNETTVSIDFTADANHSTLSLHCLEECTAQIDNFVLTCTGCDFDQDDADSLSECLCVCDEQDCTSLIKFSASRPTFGNFFDANNTPMYFRIGGRLRNPETPALDFNPFKSTLDEQVQPASSFNRLEEFATQLVPEWVHNSLTVALAHPILYIDGVSYKCTTPHSVEWADDEAAAGQSIVAKTNQGSLRNNY